MPKVTISYSLTGGQMMDAEAEVDAESIVRLAGTRIGIDSPAGREIARLLGHDHMNKVFHLRDGTATFHGCRIVRTTPGQGYTIDYFGLDEEP